MTEKFIRGACRVMYRPIMENQDIFLVPQTYKHIVNPKTFDAINNWADIGATKTGACYTSEWIKTGLAEITTQRLEIMSGFMKTFELAFLWQHTIPVEEEREKEAWFGYYAPDPHDIRFKYWRCASLSPYWKSYIEDARVRQGECSQLPIKFIILT